MLKPVALLALAVCLLPTVAHAAPAQCPVIDGVYEMIKEEDGVKKRFSITQSTRIANGVFSYAINGKDYQVADGVARQAFIGDREGRIRLTCEDGALIRESWGLDDPKDVVHRLTRYTVLGPKKILIESNDSRLSGTFSKQE